MLVVGAQEEQELEEGPEVHEGPLLELGGALGEEEMEGVEGGGGEVEIMEADEM